jgi:hypothetical protein
MPFPFTIQRLAVHYIERNIRIETAEAEVNLENLHPQVSSFLDNLVANVWIEEEKGYVYSASFVERERRGPREDIENIIDNANAFLASTERLARSLFAATPRNASTGLFAVFRVTRNEDNAVFVVAIKIQNKDGSFVRLGENALTQITVEDIQNLLLDKIQKAAIFPHPYKPNFQLKIIDRQSSDEPAVYFSQNFLGASIKKSDEHQIRRLLPALLAYAEETGQQVTRRQFPALINSLRAANRDITPMLVSNLAIEHRVFGREFEANRFQDFISSPGQLGALFVPAGTFSRTRSGPRPMKITFTDPRFRSIEIKGQPEVLERLLSEHGDNTEFRLETASSAVVYNYE